MKINNDRLDFADPGGQSALRAASKNNPRNLPCPTCHAPNRLTRRDKRMGYQCDNCADLAEGCGYY
jgi:ribosomal protein L37AE/L43A